MRFTEPDGHFHSCERALLVTLRLHLLTGEQRLLSAEVDDASSTSPDQLLVQLGKDGEVALGDRQSVPLEAIRYVEIVPAPEPRSGPGWGPERRLQDEDVEAAMRANYEPPR